MKKALLLALILLVACETKESEKDQIAVIPEVLTVTYSQTEATVEVGANGKWTAVSDVAWCTVRKQGDGDAQISIAFKINDTASERQAEVTFRCGTAVAVLAVIQGGMGAEDEENILQFFEDEKFKEHILTSYAPYQATIFTASQAAKVTNIDVRRKGLSSIKGIEYFTNLVSFNCSGNNLKVVDLTGLTKIENLNMNDNGKMPAQRGFCKTRRSRVRL